jgi:hypothetical protein
MKLLEKEGVVVAPVVVARPTVETRPDIAVRGRVVRRVRRNPLAEVCTRTAVLALAVGSVYVTSTLAGYVVLERARQSARHGAERAAYARAEAKAAREGIEALTNPAALRAWADAHGFVAGSNPEPVKTVAQR